MRTCAISAATLLGHHRDDLLGRSIHDVVPDLADSPFGRAYATAMTTGEPATVEDHFAPLVVRHSLIPEDGATYLGEIEGLPPLRCAVLPEGLKQP